MREPDDGDGEGKRTVGEEGSKRESPREQISVGKVVCDRPPAACWLHNRASQGRGQSRAPQTAARTLRADCRGRRPFRAGPRPRRAAIVRGASHDPRFLGSRFSLHSRSSPRELITVPSRHTSMSIPASTRSPGRGPACVPVSPRPPVRRATATQTRRADAGADPWQEGGTPVDHGRHWSHCCCATCATCDGFLAQSVGATTPQASQMAIRLSLAVCGEGYWRRPGDLWSRLAEWWK
jgi:hypothetical protein